MSSYSQLGDGNIVRLALKGGSVLLCGKCEKGIQWSNLTGEFFFNVIMNRSSIENPLICIYAGSPPSKYVYDKIINDKKHYINVIDASNPDIEISNIDLQLKSILLNGSSIKSYSIMVFGYTDLILRFGLNNSISFIQQCLSYKKLLSNNKEEISIIDKDELGNVIAIIQKNLHSNTYLDILKQNFTSIINTGPSSLSFDDICLNLSSRSNDNNRLAVADISIIRKSPNTGKIIEEDEIFGFDNINHKLFPLSIIKDINIKDDTKINNIQTSLKILDLKETNKTQDNMKIDRHELKITYNSNDPEWDDDPNPDDDLDL